MTEPAPIPASSNDADVDLAAGERSTRATKVVLYEDRAEVRRRADGVELQPGSAWVALGGVTPYVDDRSVQVHIHPTETIEIDAIKVTGARVRRRVLLPEAYARAEIAELEAERDAARDVVIEARARIERLESRRRRLDSLHDQYLAGLATVPRGLGDDDARATWQANGTQLDEQLRQVLDTIAARRAELQAAEDDAARAAARLQVRRDEQPRVLAIIEVQLSSRVATTIDLEVVYRTPCAAWRPEHVATIDALEDRPLVADEYGSAPPDAASDSIESIVELVTLATIWQRTGEHWDDVELALSTARPSRAASPPPVADDWIVSRKRSAEEQRQVVVESRDQALATTGVEGARDVDEMPGVDDGGEPLTFTAPATVTLPSDGEPVRVPVHAVHLDATLTRVLRPERSPVAHIRAEAMHQGAVPILAGPIQVIRGATMMGRSRIDFVAPGEPFELGFGPDDAVRVRRKTRRERDSTITGAQVVDVTIDLFLANLSESARHVTVTERIPISELDGLSIQLREAHGFAHDEATGFATCGLVLGAGATEQLTIEFRVKAPAKMVLPF